MPQLLNATGAAQWGDVENHPWTTGAQLDYFSAASLWAEWLKQKYPNGVKVASITFNSDFGKSYLNGFRHAIKGTNIQLVGDFPHDPTAPNIDNQYTSAAATGADVLLLQTTGVYCTQGMADVEKGSWKPDGHHVGDVRVAEPVLPAADRPGADGQGHVHAPELHGLDRSGQRRRCRSSRPTRTS